MNNDSEEKIVHAAPVPPFVRFVASAVPMVFDNSLSYYEALCALWKWLQDDVIDVINNNASVTELWRQELTTFEDDLTDKFNDLSDAFDTLQSWIDNYFDNLDVQEEINNKLDQMVEDGVLQEIITTYIQSNVAWTFDTVADMKLATNLVDGSFARTLGFHTLNDGGGALYKITNSGTANEMDVIAVDSLFANLIIGEHANVMQFGAYGDNTHDDSDVINYVISNFDDVYFPNKNFNTSDSIEITRSRQIVKCNGSIRYTESDAALKFISGVDNDIYIRDINSAGIGILVQPTSSCGRIKLEVEGIESHDEAFKVTGNYSTSSWYLSGLRWNSTNSYAINMEVPSAVTNIYYNRFLFNKMALISGVSDTKGILLTNLGGNGCDIQVQFTEVNFEGVKGIRTSGNVGYLSITNCRLAEIADSEWFEVNGTIPNTVITGAGRVFLKRMKFKNITAGEEVILNIRCQDSGLYQYSGYTYSGGRIIRTADNLPLFIPNDQDGTNYMYLAYADENTVGDEASRDTTMPLMTPAQIRVFNANATTTVTVPAWVSSNRQSLLLRLDSASTVTLKYGTTTVGTFSGQGKAFFVANAGGYAKYVELS